MKINREEVLHVAELAHLDRMQPLVAGETFSCSVVFQKAGTIETEVHVR